MIPSFLKKANHVIKEIFHWQCVQIFRKSQHLVFHQGKEYSFAMESWDICPNVGAVVEISEWQTKTCLNHNAAVANLGWVNSLQNPVSDCDWYQFFFRGKLIGSYGIFRWQGIFVADLYHEGETVWKAKFSKALNMSFKSTIKWTGLPKPRLFSEVMPFFESYFLSWLIVQKNHSIPGWKDISGIIW